MNRARMQACFLATSLRIFVLVMIAVLPLQVGCDKATANAKGAPIPMETYYIGRFSIAVPIEMKQAAREHKLRRLKIEEVKWTQNITAEKARTQEWDNFMAKVKKLSPPEGSNAVIIKISDFPGIGEWAKGIFYYKEGDHKNEATWRLLFDANGGGVWLQSRATLVEKEKVSHRVTSNLNNVGKAYRILDKTASRPKGDWFYLQHGAIKLPYLEQESSYVSFEHYPLKLKLEITMNETYKVEPGLIERTNSGLTNILGKYVTGVSVDRLRSRKRDAAGLSGEEELLRMSDKDGKELYFHWEYAGKENSGEHPVIRIKMSSADGNLDEKLKVWDAVLNSMQPMYK